MIYQGNAISVARNGDDIATLTFDLKDESVNKLSGAVIKELGEALDAVRAEFDQQAFHRGLEAIWQVVGDANRYVDAQAPWELRKSDPPRMQTVLYTLAETIRHLAILIQPVMPKAADNMLDQLEISADKRDFSHFGPNHALAAGTVLPKPSPVFPRFVEEEAAD